MKKFKIKVEDKEYIAEVAIIEDDEPIVPENPYYNPYAIPLSPTMQNRFKAQLTPVDQKSEARASSDDSKVLTSPANGVVVETLVSAGDIVEAGQPLFVFESMMMKSNVCSPYPGKIKKILVRSGDDVSANMDIVIFE